MAGLFKKIFGAGDAKRPDRQPQQNGVSEPLEVAKITEILRFFPLGEKIGYYPEFQKDGVLDTIVLGYGIDEHFIYSPLDIRCRRDGKRDVLQLAVAGHELQVGEVEKFCVLIPFNREDETKRDYVRRAELGPQGAFRRHNTVTLVASSSGGTLSSVDTVVRRVVMLESGIYAGHEIVLLDVMPDSLALTDQRQSYRLPTSLPAELTVRDGDTYPCTIRDFSNDSVQLRFGESVPSLAALTEYRRLTLAFNIDHDRSVKEYILEGNMYRKTNTSLVMRLQGIYKDGALFSLGLMDILDIKSNLMRHPATQQAVRDADLQDKTSGS